MDRQKQQERAGLLDEMSALVVILAGNLQRAEGIIRETDREKEYNKGALYWDVENVVSVLHRVQLLKLESENDMIP